jgi:hypothetical protein
MPSHKFHIGEIVMVKPAFNRNVPGGAYEVTQAAPSQWSGVRVSHQAESELTKA